MILIILTALGIVCTLLLAYLLLIARQELDDANGHIACLQRTVATETRRNDSLLRENDVLHAEVAHLYRVNAQLMARNDFFYAENEEAA